MLIKVDKLVGLKRVWGESILIGRENIYKLVSGELEDNEYRAIICSYYKTHASFANYVDRVTIFGAQNIPLIVRFNKEVRNDLGLYTTEVDSYLRRYYGTKFLLEDHEYMYYAVDKGCDISELEGVTVIS